MVPSGVQQNSYHFRRASHVHGFWQETLGWPDAGICVGSSPQQACGFLNLGKCICRTSPRIWGLETAAIVTAAIRRLRPMRQQMY